MSNLFRNITSRPEVEKAAIDMLRLWMDTYLNEIERQNGIPPRKLTRPRSYSQRNKFDIWPEDQLPAIVVISPGLAEKPRRLGDGSHTAKWAVAIACIVGAKDEEETRNLAGLYTAAIRALFLQRASLNQFAAGVEWLDERYDDMPDDARRSVQSGTVILAVEVDDVVTANAGPVTPDDPPTDPTVDPGDWPTVLHTDVQIEIVEEIT